MAKHCPPYIIGIDEAGRGAWAGPIVAAAVVFLARTHIPKSIHICDSKKLSAKQREESARFIMQHAVWGIGSASSVFIDREGIQAANRLVFQRALENMTQKLKDIVDTDAYQKLSIQIDGREICEFALPYIYIVNGDDTHKAIGAASIVAKTARDTIMQHIGRQFPLYGFENNKGYGTSLHADALLHHGVTDIHRKSYAPIRAQIEQCSVTEK